MFIDQFIDKSLLGKNVNVCCCYLGSNNRRTLYDTVFYKPEDDPKGSKHVALLIVA